jgi:hypothetical protein
LGWPASVLLSDTLIATIRISGKYRPGRGAADEVPARITELNFGG